MPEIPTEFVVLTPSTSFKLPANFSSEQMTHSKLCGLQEPQFKRNVGDILISVGISDILKNKSDSEVFTYEVLKDGKDLSFDITAIEKTNMVLIDPVSYLLQVRYPDVEWTTGELRKGVQCVLEHGSKVVERLMNNTKTFDSRMAELFHHGLPTPAADED